MRVAIIGAGPAGLVLGSALAQRGMRVTLVDRDGGPSAGGSWPRRGVMQFHHAHGVRPQATATLQRELPEAYRNLLDLGAEPITLTTPEGSVIPMGTRCRRVTFERAVRAAALEVEGVTLHRGHVDAVLEADGRAAGLVVDGAPLPADLVIDASGRAGRVERHRRAPASAGGVCGIAYVDRQYRLRPGAGWGPLTNPLAWQADFDGYQCLVFTHEHGIFSVLIARSTDSRDLVGLRHNTAFDAATRVIAGLSEWTDPERAQPIHDVNPGGTLVNAYRGQRGPDGALALPGLLFVGDAVCTTTPIFGRGLATTMLQVDEVLRLVDEQGTTDLEGLGLAFDVWTEAQMRPWVEDHAAMDNALRRRWAGHDLDLSIPLPSDAVLAAAAVDPRIGGEIGPYLQMTALPSSLDPVRPLARRVYESGWRPAPADGPTRTELSAVVAAAA